MTDMTKLAVETVTCPECQTVAVATMNRRDAHDFCANCDYPLFWVPSKVFRDRGDGADASLRRLPGTLGQADRAAFPCPNCSEPNIVTATVCIRCGALLRPVAPTAPIYVAPPQPPEPVPVPEEVVIPTPWWMYAGVAFAVLIPIILIVLYSTGHLGG